MARTRMIHPEFFVDEYLVTISPLARLLFAGLWCYADREGRLEDKPLKLKLQIFPNDDCNVDELLDILADDKEGVIKRYQVNGHKYIQVNQFLKYQHCHIKEKASEIPAPGGHHANTVLNPDTHHADPPASTSTSSPTSSPTPTLTSSFTSPSSSTLTSEIDVDGIGEVNKKEKEEIYKGLIAYSMSEKQVQEYFEKIPINKIASAYWSTQTKFAKLGVENFVGYFIGILRNEGLI